MNIDERFKDDSPENTVAKILKILADCGLETQEEWNDSGIRTCHSLHVSVKGTAAATNGKGVTPQLARASGYAELMERLQSGTASMRELKLNDAVTLTRQQLQENCGAWFEAIAQNASAFQNDPVSADKVLQTALDSERSDDSVTALPFVNMNRGEMTYFPQKLIYRLYLTNGLAAGNTPEEALVQGFSEIIERYNQGKLLTGKAVPPTIPDDYLRQFSAAWEAIEEIRAAGLDVLIKDCSLGEPYPVIAAAVINRETNAYHIHLGASPIFEIALERSLTELFQGHHLKDVAVVRNVHTAKNKKRDIYDIYCGWINNTGSYPIEFFNGTPTYAFKPFPDHAGESNRDLLRFILDYLDEKGKTMLVRDYSVLGFRSYRIIVPGMSELMHSSLTTGIPIVRCTAEFSAIQHDIAAADEKQAIAALIYCKYTMSNFTHDKRFSAFSGMPLGLSSQQDKMLGCACMGCLEWKLGNRDQAMKEAADAAAVSTGDDHAYFSAICQADTLLRQGYDIAQTLSLLSPFYTERILNRVETVLREQYNPFDAYMPRCAHAPDTCAACPYAANCKTAAQNALSDTISRAAAAFRHEEKAAELCALAASRK